MNTPSRTTVGLFHPKISSRLGHLALGAYELVDALGRCWFLLIATLSVGFLLVFVPQGREALWAVGATRHTSHVLAFFVTSLAGAVLVTFFASQILETGHWLAGMSPPLRSYACFAVPGMLGLFAAFLVPLLIEA